MHCPDSGRRKKLVLAFQFLSSKDTTWKCETCRARGWERARRCGFLGLEADAGSRAVWSRNGVDAAACPVTSITAKSVMLLEEFRLWDAGGRRVHEALPVLLWQAFNVLLEEQRRMSDNAW